ncbi:MAG: radical SAM protein [Deltaproteobacteria bacterium]|nr:radical SAM protein [Deltaproteobacteria bacterium]
MKAVLINAPYKELYGPDRPGIGNYFPLGLGFIAAVLRRAGHEVALIDPEAMGISEKALVERVRSFNPGFVGLSCLTPNYPAAGRLARAIKAEVDAPIAIGGPHATAMRGQVLSDNEAFDIVVVGEGEATALQLCAAIEGGSGLDDVAGIVYRWKEGFRETPPRALLKDLDSLPHPARDMVDMSAYFRPHMYWDIGVRSASMIASRGCPYRCIYCASKGTMGDRLRLHSPGYVVDEMESLVHDYGVKYIGFMDDTMILNHRWVRELCGLIRERKLDVSWHCVMRVDAASEDILRTIKDAGCRRISFGIETGDPGLLETSGKGTTLDQARFAVRAARDVGLTVINTYMFGFPGETWETVRNTIDFAIELSPHIAMFSILVPYPGTETFKEFVHREGDGDIDWSDFIFSSGLDAIPIGGMSSEDLKKALRLALRRFYMRPAQLARILTGMNGPREILGYVRGGIGVLGKISIFH